MAKVLKKSVAPIYLVGAVWLIFGLFLPLYRVTDYLFAILTSFVVLLVGKMIFPDKTVDVPDPEPAAKAEPKAEPAPQPAAKAPSTGSPELDALIVERDRAVSEMRRLNDSIKDPKISAQIDHLEELTKKIIAHVVEHPKKLPQIRKFLNYYLPTTLKLLNAYDRMDAAGVSGTNIDGTMGKIESMMDTVCLAFDRQLDALFGDEALDISTDITVMENLLAQEGLSGNQLRAE